jgi:hydroxyacylglutathione hydrolase
MKRWFALLLALVLLSAFVGRRELLVFAFVFGQGDPGLSAAVDQGASAEWVDDYYTVEQINERTFAIGEPRYYQQNFNYLLVGSERAILFDAGPGVRDIRPIAESLTDLPITFVPSHFHYDHVGADFEFERVALADLPGFRDRVRDGRFELRTLEHLGFAEGYARRSFEVTEWIKPGDLISLGDRTLQVVLTPGHTPDSISLVDLASGYVFSGDFIYPGPLYAFLPNSRMGDYAAGAETLLGAIEEDVRVFGAHRVDPAGLPELAFDDIKDLRDSLAAIRQGYLAGDSGYPETFEVNGRVEILAEPLWLQRW